VVLQVYGYVHAAQGVCKTQEIYMRYNGSDKVYVKTSSTKLCIIFNIVHGHGRAGIMEI
jgi:hypothetical protein